MANVDDNFILLAIADGLNGTLDNLINLLKEGYTPKEEELAAWRRVAEYNRAFIVGLAEAIHKRDSEFEEEVGRLTMEYKGAVSDTVDD